ncbi:MAG: hypothetical protein FJ100_19370 [Deltaproteobacteria bacterium]|nr:hypothetical protein [Deltaproteobacteria bacterium]
MNASLLQGLPGWSGLSDREAIALAGLGVDRYFRAGSVVGVPHQADSAPLLVVAGEAKLLLEVGELSLPVATLGPGDWWNVDAAFELVGCALSLRALTDVKGFLLPREIWAGLGNRQAGLGLHLLRQVLSSQLRITADLAPHAARWQHAAAAKRKPTRKDILELGMVKLIAPTARADARGQREVELVGHQGPAIAAAFKVQR